MIPTAHIEVKEKNIIAKTVLMPGDPLRAEFIAKEFLTEVTKFNNVRGMYGYTGIYNGSLISVMASGMGNPSMGIYSYELFKFYDVENIIRIGSCGSYCKDLNLFDVLLVEETYSDSSYANVQSSCENIDTIKSSTKLNDLIKENAKKLNIDLTVGKVHCSDVFYRKNKDEYIRIFNEKNCLAVEMESFALFHNAKSLNKNAACILTVSDSLVKETATTSKERQVAFTKMMELALAIH